jgi:hypothetical protein
MFLYLLLLLHMLLLLWLSSWTTSREFRQLMKSAVVSIMEQLLFEWFTTAGIELR